MMKVLRILMAALVMVTFQNCGNDKAGNREFAKEPDETVNRGTADEPTPVKMIDYMTGTWTLNKVMRGDEDVSDENGMGQGQKLELRLDGRYLRFSDRNKIDSGRYRVNEQQKSLYLESEVRSVPEEWNVVRMEDGVISMEIRNASAHGESITYLYQREGEREKENIDLVGDENE